MDKNINPKFTLKSQLSDLKGLASQQFVDPREVIKHTSNMTPSELFSTLDTQRVVEEKPRITDKGLAQSTTQGLPSDIGKYKEMWSKMYQTTDNPEKEAAYMQHIQDLYGKAPKEAEIRAAIGQTLPAFAGEVQSRGYSPKDMEELLYRTALHESMGGRYDRQMSGGPARSWWQVEPDTAYDNIQNYGHALGKDYEKAVGYSADKLKDMSKAEVTNLLETDPNFAASMAALWYLRKMPKV